MQANELIARMARDRRLDAFRAENLEHLFDEFLWTVIHDAELELVRDLQSLVKEQDVTLASGARAINAPNDLLILTDIRYKDTNADALLEGNKVTIVNQDDLL